MGITVVATVKNEEKSIREFLDSLLRQTRKPDEIIITDGGSTDETTKIISAEYIPRYPQLKLLQERCNIARGRNLAIRQATQPLIAVTDAGCRAEVNWLETLIKPLETDATVDVTGGITLPDAKTSFEKVTGGFFTMNPEEMQKNPQYISSRNIAFRKSIWEKAGGYPEELYLSGEDTLFDRQLQQIHAKIQIVPEAQVWWKPMPNFKKLISQTFTYARGNGQAGLYQKLLLKIALVYLVLLSLLVLSWFFPFCLIFWGILVIAYFSYSGIKLCKKLGEPSLFLLSIAVKFVMDITNLYGYLVGIFLYLRSSPLK